MLGDTPLHRAVWKGLKEAVQVLLHHFLCLCKLLLQYGAKTDIRNNDNQLAVELARDLEIADLIRKANEGESVLSGNNIGEDEEDFEIDEEAVLIFIAIFTCARLKNSTIGLMIQAVTENRKPMSSMFNIFPCCNFTLFKNSQCNTLHLFT